MMELFDDIRVAQSVRPQPRAAGAFNGLAVDTEGFDDMMVTVAIGATTGTPSTFTVAANVQESANGSTGWVDIAGAAIVTATAVDRTAELRVDLRAVARLRFVRVVVTPTYVGGTAPTIQVAAVVLLGQAERGPVGNSATAN